MRDYSRGMRQKIGIIQALQHDPELAILDEPTEGLDPLMQRAFYDILDELRAAGRTIFFSSHVLSEVERVCDRVAIIRHGRLVALRGRRRRCWRAAGGTSRCASTATRRRSTASPGVTDVVVRAGPPDLPTSRATSARSWRPSPGTTVHDLTIEPARLEEAFLEYYAGRTCRVEPVTRLFGHIVAGQPVAAARRGHRA